MTQLELHKKIEEFFKAGVRAADVKIAQDLISKNNDAKRFFFSQANELWLNWIWKEGFLEQIKNKAGDPAKYSYWMSELEYLTRMAEKEPAEVASIINSVKISEANFNFEVITRFLWIISALPAEQIKILTAKIRDEKWVYLMRGFHKTGYEFDKIIKNLTESKESSAILELAQAILIVKSKIEIEKKGSGFSIDDPFYVSDLGASGIFEALSNIEETRTERALQITSGIMGDIVKLSNPDKTKEFDYEDSFALYDVDFFTLEIENKRSISYREDIKKLAATIKKLVKRTVGKKCNDTNEAHRLINYIDKMPLSRSVWRLRLFSLTQCPKVFKEELKNAFLRLFEVENYYGIEGGAEYKKALKISFRYLSNSDQRAYVAQVLQYFSKKARQYPDQTWHKRTGWEILSSICNDLKNDEPQKCEEVFGWKCDEKYEPKPSIGEMQSGYISSVSPVNLSDYTIEKIVKNLKSEWTPEKINEQFKNDDFLKPRDVEGLGDALREDIKKRTDDYLKNINVFFDRNSIHSHYLYSLLRGIEEMLRDKQSLTSKQVGQIFGLFDVIKKSGEEIPFRRIDNKSWLVDWIEVHRVITDILLYILENKEIKEEVQKVHRALIINLISYLFTIKDSPSKEDEKPEYGEPYHVAINSVRGRAYEAFVVFTENDGKVLAADTKEIFKKVLLDDSLAVRFVIGRYLATFYFRDNKFIIDLFSEIFPKNDPDKKDIYLAAWEGYLSNTLYDKMFAALKEYYSHAITLNPNDYTKRKYSKGLDESLAIHLALAFVHLGLKINDPLYTQFWDTPNITRHKEFISFIGRSNLTIDKASDEWLKENRVSKEKLIEFWNWALSSVSEPKVLSGFGYWVNPDKEILNDSDMVEKMAQTLKKSSGDIDWDYGLLKRLPIFAEKDGEKTMCIILNYLLDSKNNLNQSRREYSLYRNEIKEALKIIYKNGNDLTRQKVVDLINTLIEKGSSMFWELKEVLAWSI